MSAAYPELTTKLVGATLVWSLLAGSVLLTRPELVFGS